jgi:Crp-like helix-turn-helix domain
MQNGNSKSGHPSAKDAAAKSTQKTGGSIKNRQTGAGVKIPNTPRSASMPGRIPNQSIRPMQSGFTKTLRNVLTQPLHALVQGPGTAWRIPIAKFRKELVRNSVLRAVLDRYLYVLMGQLASSAACVRFHDIGPRLARWLLMMQDRAHAESFGVTHEFLGLMLGVRRVGITTAAGGLQQKKLIEYHRGKDRAQPHGLGSDLLQLLCR